MSSRGHSAATLSLPSGGQGISPGDNNYHYNAAQINSTMFV